MGPYCKFCNNRCFTHMPQETPAHILKAYGTSTIVATCPAGQAFEKDKVGYCYDDILKEVEQVKGKTEYTFTSDQLYRLLSDTINMFVEYQNVHGVTEGQALPAAITEMFQGLDYDIPDE